MTTEVKMSKSKLLFAAKELSLWLAANDGTTDVLLERLKNYQEHGNNIKVVRIEKTIEPLGATVKVISTAQKILVKIMIRCDTFYHFYSDKLIHSHLYLE